jgi:hypothetical protein
MKRLEVDGTTVSYASVDLSVAAPRSAGVVLDKTWSHGNLPKLIIWLAEWSLVGPTPFIHSHSGGKSKRLIRSKSYKELSPPQPA